MNIQKVKKETLELYRSLPQNKFERMQRLDVRDRIIELNTPFFGYIASHVFVNNVGMTYEDKLQSALMHFCECWWWYLWEGDETHRGYRTDLSFSVFFKLRISEMVTRELNVVKYSVRRTLLMEAGAQLGKHWGKVKYEDLDKLDLPPNKMASLKALFGVFYWADLDTHSQYLPAPTTIDTYDDYLDDKYNGIEEFLIHEMIEKHSKLSNTYLKKLSKMFDIPIDIMKTTYSKALNLLYDRLHENSDMYDIYGN